jgi:hypothetical protein
MALSKILPASQEQYVGARNLIINGNMAVAQRGTSHSYAHDGARNGYNLDRFRFQTVNTVDEFDATVTQVSDSPDEFSNSLKITTGTAESSVAADEYVLLEHRLEAQNLQHLAYGTSFAKATTLSFYVKSSLTGTFGLSFYQLDSPRVINKTYTINSANTWERKSITVVGDINGVIDNNNEAGLYIYWNLGSGSNFNSGSTATTWADYTITNLFDSSSSNALITTAGATWQITGVQLEVGEATPFEHEPFSVTLHKCQRYYQKSYSYSDTAGTVTNNGALWTNIIRNASNQNYWQVRLNQEMRTNVSVTTYSTTSGVSGKFRNVTDNATNDSAVSNTGSSGFSIRPNSGSGQALGEVIAVHWVADAEL